MQPIFRSFVSGVAYRKTVKLDFRRIVPFYPLVSIYENVPFRRLLPFLTAGNKSKCGTLQRLTHPQQSTDRPILKPVSSPKRQASQGKPFILSSPCSHTSSRLRIHGTFALLAAPSSPTRSSAPLAPHLLPRLHPPSPKSHVIPPEPHSPTAQKPRNTNDPISKPETSSGELRAKLLGGTRVAPPDWRPPRDLRGLAAVPVGGGGAWPGVETTHRTTRQHTRPHWCGEHRRDRRARAGFEARCRTQ